LANAVTWLARAVAALADLGVQLADAGAAGVPPLVQVPLVAVELGGPAAAAATTDHGTRAKALAGLAPHQPAAQRAAVLEHALASAATGNDHDRAEVLVGLGPHLSSDQLLERAWDFHSGSTRMAYLRFLHDCLGGIDRKTCLCLIQDTASMISAIGGTAAVRQCANAIASIYRWWPPLFSAAREELGP
jgi:hypothetical protein